MQGRAGAGQFDFDPPAGPPQGSVLYDEHLKLVPNSRMADFAGYLMPLWYSSISSEHAAVRQTAGLFDCTHMGVLEAAGPDAEPFLQAVTTNNVAKLPVGRAHYSYILDASGRILDDIIIYRLQPDRFMIVVNAANEPKIKAWFNALLTGQTPIDINSDAAIQHRPVIRDMRQTQAAQDCRVDLALQGPASTEVLAALTPDSEQLRRISDLKPFRLAPTQVGGIDCIVARTGYTGSRDGYELFVHPDRATELWDLLLDSGRSAGLLPCGLGARDSLRIEAGLPLYGHELDGEFDISPFEAGYGWAVKLKKDFFIGKAPMEKIAGSYAMHVVRIQLSGARGIRPVRQHDAVLDDSEHCMGWVLSCAGAGDKQIALAYVDKDRAAEGNAVGIYYLARRQSQVAQGRKEQVDKNETVPADIQGRVVSRFEKF